MRLVALHGFTGEGADFAPLRAALPDSWDVVSPDFPGHGSRRGDRALADYSLASHLDTITAAVGATEDVVLLGYSMGGRLALHWTLAHPGRCRRLVLIGASPGLATATAREERRLADGALATFLRTEGLERFYKYWHNQPLLHALFRLPEPVLGPLRDRRAANHPEGLALSLENVGTGALPSLWERLGELRLPVDLVTGELDPKFCQLAREMGPVIPRARLSVVEGAGHAVHLERPNDLTSLLLAEPRALL
jgi:2-succinyl-6-hydroxy-2,4-cyclohexadiene-1-carboxylate synthase